MQSTSIAVHAGDIAITLSEDRLLNPVHVQARFDISIYTTVYILFGYILFVSWFTPVVFSKNRKHLKSISTIIEDHNDFVISIVFVGYVFVICEVFATAVHFGDSFTILFRLYLWVPSLIITIVLLPFCIIILIMHECCKNQKEKSDGRYLKAIVIFTSGILFLINIYCYALPTFLLLLVYPTKIIIILTYFTTFMFIASISSSTSIHLIIAMTNEHDGRIRMIINAIMILLLLLTPFFMFGLMLEFLYVLLLIETYATSAGLYTVLSLIPTAGITIAGWLVKNNGVNNGRDRDKQELNQENDDTEEESAANESESPTIIVNEDSPSDQDVVNGNDQEIIANEDNGNDQEIMKNKDTSFNRNDQEA